MFGTIMRVRIKPDRRDEYIKLMQGIGQDSDLGDNGMHSVQAAWEDKDPNRLVMVVHFKDRASYMANAERPETNEMYRKQLDFFDGEPEWIDVNWGMYMGKSLSEAVAAG